MSEQRNSTSPSLFPAQQSRPELPTILGNYVTEHDGVTDKIDGQHQRQTQQPSASRSNSNQLVDRNDDIILLTHNNESIQRSRRPTDVYARYRPNRHREPNLHSTFRSSSNRQTSNNSDNDTHGFRQLFNVDGNERVPSTPDEELAWHLQRQEYEQDVLDNRRNHRQHHNQFNISDYDTNESLEAAFESLPNNMSDDNNLAQRLQREEMGLQNYVRQMPHAVRVFPFYPFFNQDRNANGDDDDNDEIDVQQQFMHALMRGALHMPHGAYGRRRFHGGNRDVRHLQQYQGDFGAEDYETLLELDEITGANKQKLNDEQIKKISTVKFTKLNDLTTEGNTCSICFENFEENQSLHDYPCTHKFHKICSTRWLAENNVCPVCRVPPVIVEQTAPQHRSNVHRSYRPPRTVNNHNRDNGTDRASHNQRHGGGGRRPRFN